MKTIGSGSITVVGTGPDIAYLNELLLAASVPCSVTQIKPSANTLTFSVEPLTALIAALGSSGMLAAISRCLITLAKEKKKRITIHIKGDSIELTAENYSERQLAHLIREVQGQVLAIVSYGENRK